MNKTLFLVWFLLGIVAAMTGRSVFSNYVYPNYVNTTIKTTGPIFKSLLEESNYSNPITTQDFLSFCGVASLVNVLRSYGLEPTTQKKILTRESSSLGYWNVVFSGMTLEELQGLFDEQGDFDLRIVRPKTIEELSNALIELQKKNTRIIANFSRTPLFGENIGHHTPIGGYDEKSGNVLLLDVTEGYGNYLVKQETLFVAMQTNDSETGAARGLLIINRAFNKE